MQSQLATKVTEFFHKPNGEVIRVVAEKFYGLGLTESVGVVVHRKKNEEANWELLGDRPASNYRSMSVSEYVEKGRPEMFYHLSPVQIMSVISKLGKPISEINH